MKKIIIIILLSLLLVALVSALDIKGGDEIIIENALDESLYAAGGSISVDASVNGDVTAFGGSISINSPVTEDIMTCGGSVSINSAIGGGAHVCGGDVSINSAIGGDLFTGGGNIDVNGAVDGDIRVMAGNANINSATGDILALVGNLVVNGPVGGDIAATVGELTINSVIDGDVTVQGDKVTLGKDALIKGNLEYTTKVAKFNEDQIEGKIIKHEVKRKVNPFYANIGWKIFSGLSLFLIGLIFVLVMPKTVNRLADSFKVEPWKKLLYGFLALITVPIAAFIVAITLIGFPIAIFGMVLYIFGLIAAVLIAALFIGKLILKNHKGLVLPLILGIVVSAIVVNIPLIGGLVKLVAILFGLGAITTALFFRSKKSKKR